MYYITFCLFNPILLFFKRKIQACEMPILNQISDTTTPDMNFIAFEVTIV